MTIKVISPSKTRQDDYIRCTWVVDVPAEPRK
jgi:hypothetical protein